MKKLLFTILFLLIFRSCTPLIGIVGVASIGSASKEKGIGTSINDTAINFKISNLIFKYNTEVSSNTKVFVNNGSVLITGKVEKPIYKVELTKVSWEIRGVKEVSNEVQITDVSTIKNIARDFASKGEITARIMIDKSINSLNFDVDVVNDKAYITGVAKNKEEMKLVKDHASSARFISEVFNYIIINNDTR